MSVSFEPVLSFIAFNCKWNRKFRYIFHFLDNNLLQPFRLVLEGVEEKFVVDLQHHPAAEILFGEPAVNIYHRNLDDVGGSSLNRRVHGVPLGKGADRGIVGVDVRDIPSASEDSLHISVLSRARERILYKTGYRREMREIVVDYLLGFAAGNAQALRESEGGDSLHDAEVRGLCDAALL